MTATETQNLFEPSDPSDPSHRNYLISTHGWRAEPIEYPCDPLHENVISFLLNELDIYREERCGFITNEQEAINVKNIHADPCNNFYMDEEDATDAINYIYNEICENIIGIYHTHPNNYPWPSPRDIAGWPKIILGWRYFLVTRGNVTEWRIVRD